MMRLQFYFFFLKPDMSLSFSDVRESGSGRFGRGRGVRKSAVRFINKQMEFGGVWRSGDLDAVR